MVALPSSQSSVALMVSLASKGSAVAVLMARSESTLSFLRSMILSADPPPPKGRQLRFMPISRPPPNFISTRLDLASGSKFTTYQTLGAEAANGFLRMDFQHHVLALLADVAVALFDQIKRRRLCAASGAGAQQKEA